MSNNQPFSEQLSKKEKDLRILLVVFSFIILVGSMLFFYLFINPLINIARARSWNEVPCKINYSDIETVRNKNSYSYRPRISYVYNVAGRDYTSLKYSFTNILSVSQSRARDIISQYPTGSLSVCYVNPDNPTEVVLERQATGELWMGLFPIIFLAIGGGGLLTIIYKNRVPRKAIEWQQSVITENYHTPQQIELKAASILKSESSGLWAFAIIWNTLTAIILYQVISLWMVDNATIGLTIISIPFALVSIATIVGLIYQILAKLTPRPKFYLGAQAVALGQDVKLEWKTPTGVDKFRNLSIQLIGNEEAFFQSGKSRSSEKENFFKRKIFSTTNLIDIEHGATNIHIPANTMHSFATSNNRVSWQILVQADVAGLPDIKDEFEIVVTPSLPATRGNFKIKEKIYDQSTIIRE